MKKVLCFGEIIVDMFENETGEFVPKFGGAPANVAVGLTKLGRKAKFIGKIGDDFFGRFLQQKLKNHKVESCLIVDNLYPTTLAFVFLKNGEREFIFYKGAHEQLQGDEIPKEIFKDCLIFHFGSLLQINNSSQAATEKCLQVARLKNIFISYDPNIRLALWPSHQKARDRIIETILNVDLLKLSDEELRFITQEDSIEKGIKKIWHDNLQLLVVTLGEEGCLYRYNGQINKIPTTPVEAIDTTGAGDAFCACLLAELEDYITKGRIEINSVILNTIFRKANFFAAVACTKKGAVEALSSQK